MSTDERWSVTVACLTDVAVFLSLNEAYAMMEVFSCILIASSLAIGDE